MVDRTFEVYGIAADRDGVIRYVGMTTRGRQRRFTDHLRHARAGDRTSALYQWIRSEQFAVSVVLMEECANGDVLRSREAYWIALLPNLVNQMRGAELTEPDAAVRERMSAAAKARFLDPRERAKIWPASRSRETTDETREKLRAANLRRYEDPAERERTASYARGRKLSPAHIAAIRRHNIGKKASAETRMKLSAAKAGKPWHPGHIRWHVKRGIINPACVFCVQG